MRAGNKWKATLAGAVLAPVVAVALPASSASAHGYVSSPPSRQAQCAAGTVSCGAIKYEPQSVEGPKGLKSCSGGNAGFDDDSKGWVVTPVLPTTTFAWRLTARHATSIRSTSPAAGRSRSSTTTAGYRTPPSAIR